MNMIIKNIDNKKTDQHIQRFLRQARTETPITGNDAQITHTFQKNNNKINIKQKKTDQHIQRFLRQARTETPITGNDAQITHTFRQLNNESNGLLGPPCAAAAAEVPDDVEVGEMLKRDRKKYMCTHREKRKTYKQGNKHMCIHTEKRKT